MEPLTDTILVTNDDGVRAQGLDALARALAPLARRLLVVAPDREQSGISHALTIRRPLRLERVGEDRYTVDGSPADCVDLAVLGLLDGPPGLVVSGINPGYNLGDDVIYSGTVAGAREGHMLGIPALAISTAFDADEAAYASAAGWAVRLARMILAGDLPAAAFLNVNVPPGAAECRVTRQGRRASRPGLLRRTDPKGKEYWWIGLAGSRWRPDREADHAAVAAGVVSITPLQLDSTCTAMVAVLRRATTCPAGTAEEGR